MTSVSAQTPTPEQVKTYYNAFSADRMLSYRVSGNLRIERAIDFFCDSILPNDNILDVGCGIGIATEAMAARTKGFVLGIDISDQNIWYASNSTSKPNLEFFVADVLNEQTTLPLRSAPSVITLCDVIEHIPDNQRATLFKKFAAVGDPSLRVLLTYPTAFNLKYLEREAPSEIQIIDNKIPPEVLAQEAALAGLSMTYFKMISVWRNVEYAHCIFERNESLQSKVQTPAYLNRSIPTRFKSKFVDPFLRRARRKKYIDAVFGKN